MKPNNFPVRPNLDGTEELYTQTNSISQKFTLESAKAFITEPIDITYTELYNKVINGELVTGSWYRLLDYKSVNFLNGLNIAYNNPVPTDPNFIPQQIYEGIEEILLLQAKTPYEICEIGYSETFNGDIIQYQPYTNKIGLQFEIYNGSNLPNSTAVSGFDLQWDGTNVYFNIPIGYPPLYGQTFILSAEFDGGSYDIQNFYFPLVPNISTPTFSLSNLSSRIKVQGQKIILLDLTQNDYLLYDTDTLFVQTIYALGDAYGHISRRQDTFRNIDVPLDFRGRKYRRFECEIFGNITGISYTATGSSASNGIYYINNYSSTSLNGSGALFKITVVASTVSNVEILNSGRLYVNGDTFIIDGGIIGGISGVDDIQITVSGIYSNINYWGQGDNYKNSPTTGNFQDCSIFGEFANINYNIKWSDISIASSFNGENDNVVFFGLCYDVKIGSNCSDNTISADFVGNVIGNNFLGNTILDNFGGNVIGNNFYNNVIGYYFETNNISNTFSNNFISESFANNSIQNNFSYNNIGNGFQYNNIGSNFEYNNIGNTSSKNSFGSYIFNNTIQGGFENNLIGNYFDNNNIGLNFDYNNIQSYFENNTIQDSFENNTIGNFFYQNNISDNFKYNKIGEEFYSNNINEGFGFGFSTSQGNVIGNFFYNNVIGEYFYNNHIVDGFYNNTVVDYFQLNDIKISINNTNFFSATHVYAAYSCEIFKASDTTNYLRYFDGTLFQHTTITT